MYSFPPGHAWGFLFLFLLCMPIHIPTIETAIKAEVSCTSPELETILEEVRSAITQHLLQFSLVPQGIFQIRLVTAKERTTTTPREEQTYLVVSF
jgi:hypothetical protein